MELLVDVLEELAKEFGKDNAWMLKMKARIEKAILNEGWRLSVPYEMGRHWRN